MSARAEVRHNIGAHDSIANRYEAIHGEIFNPVEQDRLRSALAEALSQVTRGGSAPTALDYGCGSGNLTHHLLQLGCNVVAADVSPAFLRIVRERYSSIGRLETMTINGEDLLGIPENRFDVVAMYSVLHHVPDYLRLLKESARVIRRGGILYLDHEHSTRYWTANPEYAEFLKRVQEEPAKEWRRFFVPSNYVTLLRRRLNPRYQPEGDIHVWPDDHIEWDKVIAVLEKAGCEIVREEDYLLYVRGYRREIFQEYRARCADTHLLVAKKL